MVFVCGNIHGLLSLAAIFTVTTPVDSDTGSL